MAKVNSQVELYYSGAWHDLTAANEVLTRDPIRITRGRPNAAQKAPASSLSLSLRNIASKFSPRHPMSALYRLIGRNTPIRVSVRGYDITVETFNRVVSAGWGQSEYDGTLWVSEGAGAPVSTSDYRITVPGTATHRVQSTSSYRITYLPLTSVVDVDATVTVRLRWADDAGGIDVLGNDVEAGLMLRVADNSHYYHPRVELNADQSITASLFAIGGTGALGSVTPAAGITYTGQWLRVKAQAVGTTIRMKVWQDGAAEPAAWDLSVVNAEFAAAGTIGVRSGVATGNTNVGRWFSYQDLTIDPAPRMTGEVASWPQEWTVDGKDVWASIAGAGITQRFTAAGIAAPAVSALKRRIPRYDSPAGYWPMEDGSQSTVAASALPGGKSLSVEGTVNFASSEGPAGSASLCDGLTADQGTLLVPDVIADGVTSWQLSFVVRPTTGANGLLATWQNPAGTYKEYRMFRTADTAGGFLYVSRALSPTDTADEIVSGTAFDMLIVNDYNHIIWKQTQTGPNITFTLYINGAMIWSGTKVDTSGPPRTVRIAPYRPDLIGLSKPISIGHWAEYSHLNDLTPQAWVMRGHLGESARQRLVRLCAEDGITLGILGPDDTEPVGVQRVAPFMDLLQDAADADGGILAEPRGYLGLMYRTRRSLYNQTPALTLDYAAGGEVAPPLRPVEDWDATANDVTVKRYQGSSARAVQQTGPLNVQEPGDDPDGVGTYPKEYTLVLASDDQCLNQAAWRKGVGTQDEARYPIVNADITAMQLEGKTALIARAASLDIGDRLTITHPPASVPPESIDQHAQGLTEDIGSHRWTIAANATPALPYGEVLQLETGTGNRSRIPAGASTLAVADGGSGVTSLYVFSSKTLWIDSAGYAAQFPLDIMIRGERMTVAGIANYLNLNPYFEAPLNAASWTPSNGAIIAASGAQFHQGAQSLLITPDGVSFAPQVQSEDIPVTAGRSYTLSGWLRSASSGTRKLGVFWYDGAHVFISANEISQVLAPGVWTVYGPTAFVAPVGAVYARLTTNDPGAPLASNTWRVDEATLSQANTQLFTVVRAVNGMAKAHAAGEPVQLFHPAVLAL